MDRDYAWLASAKCPSQSVSGLMKSSAALTNSLNYSALDTIFEDVSVFLSLPFLQPLSLINKSFTNTVFFQYSMSIVDVLVELGFRTPLEARDVKFSN